LFVEANSRNSLTGFGLDATETIGKSNKGSNIVKPNKLQYYNVLKENLVCQFEDKILISQFVFSKTLGLGNF